jgi:hypothetical protein
VRAKFAGLQGPFGHARELVSRNGESAGGQQPA